MKPTLWTTHKSPVAWAYILTCLVVAATSSFTLALSRAGAWDAGFDNARFVSAVAVPVFVAAHWGQLNDVQAEHFRLGLGVAATRQRRREFVAICVLVAEGLTLCVVLPGLLVRIDQSSNESSTDLLGSLVYTSLTAAMAVLLTTATSLRNTSPAAISRGALVALVYVLVYFGPVPGRLGLLAIFPTTAPGAIVRGAARDGSTLVVLAALSISITAWFSLQRLGSLTRTSAAHGAPRTRKASTVQQSLSPEHHPIRLAGITLGIAAVAGAVLPSGSQAWLPPDLRPSLALQRLDGRGPEQIAQAFFRTYRQGETDAADNLTVTRDSEAVMTNVPGEVLLAEDGAYRLRRSPDLERAFVAAQMGAAQVCFSMRYESDGDGGADGWHVAKVSVDGC